MTDYLTIIEIMAIHKVMINRYGGTDGVRDIGAIEAACHRPQSGYYDNIITEAAVLMESLAMNHPFLDGNKRVAFAAADVFFRINGYKIVAESVQIHEEIMQLFDSNRFEFKYLDEMLRKYVVKL